MSRSQAAYDLADMVTLGILERVGTGRATRYRPPGGSVAQQPPRERAGKPVAGKPHKRAPAGGRPRKWTKERIRTELEAFCGGRNGHWPQAAEFRKAGRSDLYLAASRYGGIDFWTAELGLRKSRSRRLRIRVPAFPRQRLSAWALAAFTMLAVIGLGTLLQFDRSSGRLVSAEPPREASAPVRGGDRPQVARSEESAPRAKVTAGKKAAPTAASAGFRPSGGVADVLLVARGGECWLAVRRGSAAGKTLYEGTLVRGRTLRLRGERLWLRLGAPHNLDARVNGRRVDLPERTSTVLISRRGLRVVRVASAAPPPPPEEPEVAFEEPVLASSTASTSSSSPPPPPPPPPPSSSTGSGGSSSGGESPAPEPAPSPPPAPSPDPKPRQP